jgi:muramoyltetrapeptide carboxypeptidase
MGSAFLKQHGFVVRYASNVSFRGGPLSLAGSVEERLSGYLDLLVDPEVEAILFTRGGYGAVDVVSRLDPAIVRANPKLHCGFSDVTVLASFLLERCGIPSIHGPMVAAEMARPFEGLPALYFPSILMGDSPQELVIEDADILVPGRAEGTLIGGCLSLLASVCGTPEEFSYEGGLLFFEDTGEEAYRIDRMLAQLSRAGRLQKVTGVLVGNLSNVTFGGREDHQRLRSVLVERLSPLGVPVVWGLPAGHRGPNVPLAVGVSAVWDSESRTLKFCEEIVS